MYTDYFLNFGDQADVVLFSAEGEAKYEAVDVIGVIYKPTGEVEQTIEGMIPTMAPISGRHVNVEHMEAAPELDAYAVVPVNPVRRWA